MEKREVISYTFFPPCELCTIKWTDHCQVRIGSMVLHALILASTTGALSFTFCKGIAASTLALAPARNFTTTYFYRERLIIILFFFCQNSEDCLLLLFTSYHYYHHMFATSHSWYSFRLLVLSFFPTPFFSK